MYQLVIEDDEGKTTTIPLPTSRDEITIGRKEGNTIRLTERNVSRQHARIVRSSNGLFIEDKGSYNGVKVNGDRISGRRHLKEGDDILIGDYHLSLQLEKGPVVTRTTRVNGAPIEPTSTPMVSQTSGGTAIIRLPLDKQEELRAGQSASPQNRGQLCLLSGPIAGTLYPITRDEIMIGRTEENDVVLNHRSISRNHAKILIANGVYQIVDMGSANGIRVNGEEYGKIDLRRGDKIDLGHVRLRFVAPGENFIYDPSMREEVTNPDEASQRGIGFWLVLLFLLLATGLLAAYFLGFLEPFFGTTYNPVQKPTATSVPTTNDPTSTSLPTDIPTPNNDPALQQELQNLLDEKKWDEAVKVAEKLNDTEMLKVARAERDANYALINCLEARDEKDYDTAMAHCFTIAKETQVAKEFNSAITEVEGQFRSQHMADAEKALEKAKKQKSRSQLRKAEEERTLLERYFGKDDPDVAKLTRDIFRTKKDLEDAQETSKPPDNPPDTTPPDPTPPVTGNVRELVDDARNKAAQKDHGAATTLLKKAKKINSGYSEIYQVQAFIYSAKGQINLACASFKTYLKLSPSGKYSVQAKKYLTDHEKAKYPNCDGL